MRIPPVALALVVALSSAVHTSAQTVYLQNDSYGGGAVLCYTGVTSDRGIAR